MKAPLGAFLFFQISLQASGLIQNLRNEVSIQSQIVSKLIKNTSTASLKELNFFQSYQLDDVFLDDLLFRTPSRFIKMITKDYCSLYDLILSNQIKSSQNELKFFIVDLVINDKESIKRSVSFQDFKKYFIAKKCPQSLNFEQHFNEANLKRTLQSSESKQLFRKNYSSLDECLLDHKNIQVSHKLPYLCKVSEQVASIPSLEIQASFGSERTKKKDLLSKYRKQRSYLEEKDWNNLKLICQTILHPKLYCDKKINKDFYIKIKEKEKSYAYVQNHCKELFKDFTKDNLNLCLNELSNNKSICHNLNQFDGAFVPKPNCQQVAKALTHSHLFSEYTDCPGTVQNDTMTTLYRLIRHYEKDIKNKEKASCQSQIYTRIAQYSMKNGPQFWKNQICYTDKVSAKKVCIPTIYASSTDKELSFSENVKNVLQKMIRFSAQKTCKVVSQKKYKPSLLEFKSGCFIIKKSETCHPSECDYQVIVDTSKKDLMTFHFDFEQEFYHSSYQKKSLSQLSLLIKNFKLKSKKILNTTVLKNQFRDYPKTIIVGMGCLSDLYPEIHLNQALGACKPISFIIDGHIQKDNVFSVIIRTSMDALHSPRIIPWSRVYQATRHFQITTPLNIWSLDALY